MGGRWGGGSMIDGLFAVVQRQTDGLIDHA